MPCVLSRERFVTMYEKNAKYEANHDFSQFAQENVEHIDPNMVQQDLDKLSKLSNPVIEFFADRRIAHFDKRSVSEDDVPSFGELDSCIDFLAKLTKKYWLLFKAADIDLLVKPIVDNWEEIFRQPWIPPYTPNQSIDPDPLDMY